MAGFSDRAKGLIDLQVVPYPAVTVFIDLSDGVLVDYASGQQQRGSLAAGLAPGNVRARGRHIECLQVWLLSGWQPRSDGAASACGPGSDSDHVAG
jgi:hypothetical protein